MMDSYGKFKVGQRVKTTCEYKRKYSKSFKGTITSIFADKECSFRNRMVIGIDGDDGCYSIFDTVCNCEKYLEIMCPNKSSCKFKIGDHVRTTDKHDCDVQLSKYHGQITDIKIRNFHNNISYNSIVTIDKCGNKHFHMEDDLELDCSSNIVNNKDTELSKIKNELSIVINKNNDYYDKRICHIEDDLYKLSRKVNNPEKDPIIDIGAILLLLFMFITTVYGALKFIGVI